MRVLLIPQVGLQGEKITYQFEGEIITATFNDVTDVFDFSGFNTDGESLDIETSLSINPIIHAKRDNGILNVKLLNYISDDATEEEKFPEWVDING